VGFRKDADGTTCKRHREAFSLAKEEGKRGLKKKKRGGVNERGGKSWIEGNGLCGRGKDGGGQRITYKKGKKIGAYIRLLRW